MLSPRIAPPPTQARPLTRRHALVGLSTAMALATAACVAAGPPGPPPHAPAHGHRWRHPSGVVLMYDSGLGVYVVVGRPSYYFWDGSFYWLSGDVWYLSPRIDRDWRPAGPRAVPPGLVRRHPGKGPHGRG